MLPKDQTPDLPDEIVEEVRAVRHAHAAARDFDLARIFQDLKRREVESGVPVVSLPPRPIGERIATGAARQVGTPEVRPSSPAVQSDDRG